MKTLKNQHVLVAILLISFAFFLVQTQECHAQDWAVPAKYKSMNNPEKDSKEAVSVGKSLWKLHCASCHGNEGLGDGKKSTELDTPMREIGSKEVQAQTDGELYYKSFIGRDEMPNFEKKIASEKDRWLLVEYMRKLK